MDTRPDPGRLTGREGGFTTAQWALTASFSMVFLALLVQLIAVQYAQGVMRAALDEGIRRATPAPAGEDQCREGIAQVLEDLLAGPMGQGITWSCAVSDGQVVAAAEGTFAFWFPGVPDITWAAEVRAVKEVDG